MDKPKLLISFSGGRTSALMTYWLLNSWKDTHEMIVVFANTGKEREETLEFIHRCDEHFRFNVIWIEAITNPIHGQGITAKVLNFKSASRNGEPFEAMIAKHGIPNQNTPHCSRELKGHAIRAYARAIGWKDYQTAIGIRKDEPKRLDWIKAKKENIIYPLALDFPCSKFDVNQFWWHQPFDLKLKSYEGNCDLCWKKSFRKLITILAENPEKAIWWQQMEDQYGEYIPEQRRHNKKITTPILFFREQTTVSELIEESKFDFEKARDESQDINSLLGFQNWNEFMDSNGGCVESCEVF